MKNNYSLKELSRDNSKLLFSLKKLKITLFLSLCIWGSCHIAYGQNNISISVRNQSVQQVIDQIEEKTKYVFFFDEALKKDFRQSVSVNIQSQEIEQILDKIFESTNLTYKISDRQILIFRKESPNMISPDQNNRNPSREIKGMVYDQDGEILPGASVVIKGSQSGTTADAQGCYRISVPDIKTTVLIFSFLGMEPKEVSCQGKEIIDVVLKDASTEIGEVVVTGIYSRPVENFTGSANTIKGEDLRKASPTDVFKSVAALDPAFNVIANNVSGGNINQMPEIQLRGQNSFPTLSDDITTNPNQPLFILDGFEVSIDRIKDLDINIINTIVILKDASATTIYGSRGANGVMVITTLQPKPGKLHVSVINDLSIATPDLSVYKLMDASQKLDFEQRVGIYSNSDPNQQYALDQLYNKRLKDVVGGIDTDWRRLPVQTGVSNRTTVSLDGGDEFVRYGINVGANIQNGVMKGEDRKNYHGQFDFSYLVSKIQFSNSARFYQTTSNESPYGSYSTYLKMNPYWAPYDADGNLKYYLEEFVAEGTYDYKTRQTNPLYNATLNTIDRNKKFGFQDNLNIRYNINTSLFINSKLGITKEVLSSDYFLPGAHTSFDNVTDQALKGEYKKAQTEQLNYEFSTYLNYQKGFGKHLVLGTFSFEMGSQSTDGYSVTAVGFPTDNLDHILYGSQYKPNSRPGGSEKVANRIGLLLNANYSYDNRYLADISIRRDGSSQYGTNRKFGTFSSFGIGWNVHNEAFFKTNKRVNRLKLRMSYGSTGSMDIPAYTSLTHYRHDTDNTYDGELGISRSSIGNPNLGWQEKREFNIGADIELFNSQLNARLDYYNSTTNQAIIQLSLAPSVGAASYYENYGKINNKGIEFTLQYKVINNLPQNIVWTVFANGLHNKNILLEISDNLKSLNKSLNGVSKTIPNFLFEEGKSTTSIYAVQSLGIDPATGEEVYLKKNGTKTYTWSAEDKVVCGNSLPKIRGTFGSNVYIKGFELGLIFDYRYGGQIYNQTLVDKVENIDPLLNADERIYNLGWSKPGDLSLYRQIDLLYGNKKTYISSRFVEDDNTLSISSLSLGYTFINQGFIKKWGLNSLRVRATANEVARFSSVKIERGTESPFARTYSLSVNASF